MWIDREWPHVPEPKDEAARHSRFRSLYEDHYAAVSAFALRRAHSAADGSDAVAEVFTIAWRRLDKVPEPPRDLLWLYGVAHRVIANQRRSFIRRSNLVKRLQDQVQIPQENSDGPAVELVRSAIEDLRVTEKEALRLVLWEGLSHAEAASVLGCSSNAVAIRVHRAKLHMQTALASRDIESRHSEPTGLPSRRARS
jgi:RNA polymerase sigma-70 factor (ECF subfamily)